MSKIKQKYHRYIISSKKIRNIINNNNKKTSFHPKKPKDLLTNDYLDEEDIEQIKEAINKKKGRQGRSATTRINRRKRKYNEELDKIKNNINNYYFNELNYCRNCLSNNNIMLDSRSADCVCMDCGMIIRENINDTDMVFDNNQPYKSKPYERVVHYQQKISSVRGKDPEVSIGDIRKIEEYLIKNKNISGASLYFVGWMAIKQAVSDLRLNNVYSNRWIQIRSKFNIANINLETADIPYEFEIRLRLRYFLVSEAFDNTIFLERKKNENVCRRNMINLNFIIPCLMRMESELLFQTNARFFPMNRSDNQPKLNNERLKKIIDYCQKHFTRTFVYKNETINLTWEYIPISCWDILNYFNKYR